MNRKRFLQRILGLFAGLIITPQIIKKKHEPELNKSNSDFAEWHKLIDGYTGQGMVLFISENNTEWLKL